MKIFVLILLFILALILIIYGGKYVVDVASKICKYTNLNEVLVGSTLVSLATTLPELTIAILGTMEGASGIVIGEGLGTVIVNCCLILGLSMSFSTLKTINKSNITKIIFLTVCFCVVSVLSSLNFINIYSGLILLTLFFVYIIYSYIEIKDELSKKEQKIKNDKMRKIENEILSAKIEVERTGELHFAYGQTQTKTGEHKGEIISLIIKFIVGTLLIFAGAQLIINATENLSRSINTNSQFLALSLISMGTSIPELATTIISIKKRRINLALGNLIGSNIIILTLLFGISALLSGEKGMIVSSAALISTFPFLTVAAIIIILPILLYKRTFKWQGCALLCVYLLHLLSLILIF